MGFLRLGFSALIGLVVLVGFAHADTISFSSLELFEQGSTTINVDSDTGDVSATLTTPDGKDFFVGAAGEGTEICALSPTDFLTCRADIDIVFSSPINLLGVQVFGIDDLGDSTDFFAYYDANGDDPLGSDGLIGSLNINEDDLTLIGSSVLTGNNVLVKPWESETWIVEFDGLSGITRLSIRDASNFSGFAYDNFMFVVPPKPVPEAPSLLLFGMGLAGLLGVCGRESLVSLARPKRSYK